MHKTWEEISGVFKCRVALSARVNPKRESHSQASTGSSYFSAMELFPFSFSPLSVTERVTVPLSMHCSMHTNIQCISINVKSCVFFPGLPDPLIFIQLIDTLSNHFLLLHCR